MKHDIFEINPDMSPADRLWRVLFLVAIIATVLMDLFYWRAA